MVFWHLPGGIYGGQEKQNCQRNAFRLYPINQSINTLNQLTMLFTIKFYHNDIIHIPAVRCAIDNRSRVQRRCLWIHGVNTRALFYSWYNKENSTRYIYIRLRFFFLNRSKRNKERKKEKDLPLPPLGSFGMCSWKRQCQTSGDLR